MSQLYTRNFAIAITSQSGFVMANLLMAHYARWIAFLGGSVSDVGWIMGLGAFGSLLFRPWMGQWLNRLGARRTWALGYALFFLGALGNLSVHDLNWAIYAMRACLVLGVACVSASSLTYVSQTSPADRQTEAIGILGVGGFIGFILGPYLGDLILGDGTRTRSNFLWLFVTAGGMLVLPAVLLLFLRPATTERSVSTVRLKEFVQTIVRHWPGTILIVIFTFGTCMTVPLAFLAKFIDEKHVAIPDASEIGVFFLFYAALGLIMRIGFRRAPQRFGRRKVLLVGVIAMSSGMFSFLLVDAARPWLLIVPGILCGTGHGLMFHTGTALVIESFPSGVRGTGSALSFMLLDLGLMIGAPVLGQIADALGYRWMFATVGVACLVVGAAYACASIPVWRERAALKAKLRPS